ncbi:hypothetical protein ENUP19_0139G0060 [Entamoeba nuttalli]|uniref:Exocyst complex component sec15, putative n=2 Tax=Entamoeba nuttalli TaxID=412467 RepID=K2H5L4_ENTNP|nr:exocyst complex component sec15, putative [Entamoeba nuttalli P19]EKE37769.1 exocyst complex component sec15, putative [Entamoeba nuttalli P19]|eukprot:XP_008859890.1 exocyst complex component sec15, putative [Entamoeba nuttalli P19]
MNGAKNQPSLTKEKREQFSDVLYSISHSEKYETVLKEVIENGKENDLEAVLQEYVDKRETEIQTICNDQFQKFIGCTEQLGTVKEKMIKTQERLEKTSSQAKESSDILFSKIKLLSNNRVSTVNIMKTLGFVEKLKTILETVKGIEDDISNGHISKAFIVYDRLRKLQLFEQNEYKIIQLINLRLETIKSSIKNKAIKLFDRWCEAVNEDNEKIGISILDHNKELIVNNASSKEEDYDAFEKSEINFVWLYEAYFIHMSFHTEQDFINQYKDLQEQRYTAIQSYPNQSLQQMLSRMLGFFVIEHQVQQTTENIVKSEDLQKMWGDAAQKLKTFSSGYLSLKQGLDVFLKTKDQMTYFIKAVKVYDYDASPLVGALQSIFAKYAIKIGEQYYERLKNEIKPELFQATAPTTELQKQFMTLIETTSNPNMKSITLPTIYSRAFYLCLEKLVPFIEELERYEMELDIALEPICGTMQEYLYELLKIYPEFLKSNNKATLQITYQILVDLEGFEKTTPLICSLISDHFGKRFSDLTKIAKEFNIKQKTESIYKGVKEWICEKYLHTIQDFMKTCDTMSSISSEKSHEFIDSIINFTKNQFSQLSILSPVVVSEIQTQMLQKLNESLTSLISNCQKFNCNFIKQFQCDINAIENFCMSNPTFKSQVYTFVWCKQVSTFFNSPHPEEFLVEETRNKLYNKLSDKTELTTLINKFDTNSLPRNDPRKKAYSTVKGQLSKLKF